MKTTNRIYYEAPATAVVELKTQGIICQSLAGAGVNGYGWNTVPEE